MNSASLETTAISAHDPPRHLSVTSGRWIMTGQEIYIPADVAKIAQDVVDAYLDQDADLHGLQRLIAFAILADRIEGPDGARFERTRINAANRAKYAALKEADPERLRALNTKKYASAVSTPERRARMNETARLRTAQKTLADPEAMCAARRNKRHNRRARIGDEAFRAAERAKEARQKAANPEKYRERGRKHTNRAWARKNPEQMADLINKAVGRSYPPHVRDDVRQMIADAMLKAGAHRSEVAAFAKQCMTAYWRERPEYRQTSMDAQRFDDGKATLHDAATKGLWSDE